MMSSKIFLKASYLIDKGKVNFAGTGHNRVYYEVNDPEDSNHYLLQLETTSKGTGISCSCKAGSLHWENLCCHKIAVIIDNFNRLKEKRENAGHKPKCIFGDK